MMRFQATELASQTAFFAKSMPEGAAGYGGAKYRLVPEQKALNLAPELRETAAAYFLEKHITWHQHANHALSSQVSCLNFLMPLATHPHLLGEMIGKALGIPSPVMIEVEAGPGGCPWFIGFEWIGRHDYLNEAGKSKHRTRGANATSADAIVRFKNGGRVESVLIEWKYTESYGAPIPPKGNNVRVGRYKDIIFAPGGPVRADCGLVSTDFFWEPYYQMLRQQMLAFRMQEAREDDAERVRVLHISPKANGALHTVTAPALRRFGNDAYDVFRGLLVQPGDFVARSTESVFGQILSGVSAERSRWAEYILDRYVFLNSTD